MSHAPPPAEPSASPGRFSALPWLLRFGLAFGVLNTLLTFENRWPGFGVLYMPRLSFELCIGAAVLMAWVSWRGRRMYSEQDAFFGLVMAGKDHWNAAFFCGTGAVLRREALLPHGDATPRTSGAAGASGEAI